MFCTRRAQWFLFAPNNRNVSILNADGLVCFFFSWFGKTESPFVICEQRRSTSKRWRVGFISPRECSSSYHGTGAPGHGDQPPHLCPSRPLARLDWTPTLWVGQPGWGKCCLWGLCLLKWQQHPQLGAGEVLQAQTPEEMGASFFWQNTSLYNRSPLCSLSCLLLGVRLFLALLTAISVHMMIVGSNASSDIQT